MANPTRQSAFVWIYGSFFISANEIRVSQECFFCTGTVLYQVGPTETHGLLESVELRPRMKRCFRVEFMHHESENLEEIGEQERVSLSHVWL